MEIFDLGLSPYEIVVLVYIRELIQKHGRSAFPKYETIALKCGMSVRKAKYVVKKLVEDGLLLKESGDKDRSNVYELPTEMLPEAEKNAPDAPTKAAPDAQDAHYRSKSLRSLNTTKPLKHLRSYKDSDIDYNKIYAKMSDDNFCNSKLMRGIGILQGSLPSSVFSKAYDQMLHDLDASDYESDNGNDIFGAIRSACSKFNEFFMKGHRISNYGTYFVSIFKDMIQRRRDSRCA